VDVLSNKRKTKKKKLGNMGNNTIYIKEKKRKERRRVDIDVGPVCS
jgi:hypothetical protein